MIEAYLNNETGILTLSLNRPKVNAQNTELLTELAEAFEQAEANTKVKGVLFKGEGKCFSAGLDLQEVVSLDKIALTRFLALFDRSYSAVYECNKPVAVVVQGHAIAGGAILTLMADYIAFGTGPGKFGVTELAVGVPFPTNAFNAVYAALPLRARKKMIYTASLVDFTQAYEMGIGDSLTDDPQADALKWLAKVTSFPLKTFAHTKRQWRAKAKGIASNDVKQKDDIVDILTSDEVKATLNAALQR